VTASIAPSPDLLRRFTPAPYEAFATIGDISVQVQTNDLDIVSEMQRLCSCRTTRGSGNCLLLTVIREDGALEEEAEPTVISGWPVTTVLLGTRTVLALDTERCELLGFLSNSIPARQFAAQVLPLILDLFHQPTPLLTNKTGRSS